MDVGSISGQQAAAALVEAPAAVAVTDDTTLMLRYRDGDARAFELLYERHKGPLYRYLQRMCGRREVADDLFQEVWSKVIASRSRYEVRAQFNTFLFRIAHNCAIDYFRRSGRPHENAAQDIDDVAEQIGAAEHERPDAALSEAQVRSDFRRALAELPAEQRDVFVLYEESGLTLEEIGRITGVAMETAKSRLRYAVGKLRTALSKHRPRHFEPSVQS
jgi:RNA polymerase sigma-70 factor (ECF subfamily)